MTSWFDRSCGRAGAGLHIGVLLSCLLLVLSPPAFAGDEGVMVRGDAAVTQFSGSKPNANVPKGQHPLDVTFIDTEGLSLNVVDLSQLGGPASGQLAAAKSKLAIKAKDIGQVFGVVLDSATADRAPNIYAGATSLFGLQIAGKLDGKTIRLAKGEPGAAWMPGQFGFDKGGGPGSIWKIDGKTGAVSLFSTVTTGNTENAGPGLGAIAFDPLTQQLYVTSLETGLIHRIDTAGRDLSTFDHGVDGRIKANLDAVPFTNKGRMDIESPKFSVENPDTWGYAAKKRLAVALAIENDRLYYSVAEGPVIWSVGLGTDGSFLNDARLEIDVTGTPGNNLITGIAFDGPKTMYLTQRGEGAGSYEYATFARAQKSSVLRYKLDEKGKAWIEAPEEYAVGLEPAHRATNGGLALGYGYDRDGKIDYSRCRQTLWTTGEHLRRGASDGNELVHGLQGTSTSNSQAAVSTSSKSGSTALQGDFGDKSGANLTPPSAVWFTDNDGTLDGAKWHGHVGAIAIYSPCDGDLEIAERPAPVPFPPTPSVPGIYVSKVCFPGLIGGKITCRITVTNTGIEPSYPVNITDTSTILAGPGFGGAVPISSAAPDGPDWFCTPAPTTAFACLLPAGILQPGQSRFVDVVVDTGPLTVAGNSGFRNCAALDAPYSDIACTEGGTGMAGLVIQKTGPAVCNPGTSCTFALAINNTGSQPFNGNIQISDAMFVAGAGVAAPITASSLNCIGGNPPALPFTCVVPGSIPPAGAQTYSITVTMPAAPPNYWAQNCFAAFDPSIVPPGGPLPAQGGPGGPGFGSPANPSCIWIKAGNPPPQSNLIVSKTPVNVTCASSLGTGIASCQYTISIKNDGPSPFNNVISINETPPVGSNLILNPNWPCVAGPPGPPPGFTCTSPAAVAIAPGASFTMTATIQIPALLTEPTCQVPNAVAINAPLGGPLNLLGGDDTAAASHNTALIAVLNPDGTVSVACDPTNLKTEKKIESCTSSANSTKCKYSVTVTNTGPDPYQGPITIQDQFSAAPSATSFSGAGWSCSGAGTGYLCTKPGVELAPPGKPGINSVTLEIEATIPKSPGQCVVRNSAHMSFPLAGTRFNGLGTDDSDSVSTPVKSPECEKRPVCESPGDGETSSASGACVCKEGYARDKSNRCVAEAAPPAEEPEVPTTCPDGNPIPRSGVCPCAENQDWNSETKRCEGLCEPGENEYRSSAGQCLCKTGYSRRDGRCTAGDEGEPERAPRCEPGPNEYRNSKGDCICREGYDRSEDGRCVKEPEQCTPGPNEARNSRGDCVCRNGYTRDNDGDCVKPKVRCELGPNEVRDGGACVCRNGYERNRKGVCEKEVELCQPGANEYRTSKNQCVCKEGYDRDGKGRCVKEAPSCNGGFHLENGKCVPNFDPAALCKASGGTWRNGTCVSGPTPADLCKQRGGTWNGATCVIPQKECPSGTTGKYPNCKKVDVPKCPTGTTGTYPNCKKVEVPKCPAGTAGTYPNCKKVEVPKCPTGTTGTYPNCKKVESKKCPAGFQGTPPVCFKLNEKKPETKPEPAKPTQPVCGKDQIFIGGKCQTPG